MNNWNSNGVTCGRPKMLPPAKPFRWTSKRRGVSLLEAILALAILGGALAVLSQIMDTGVDAGREANDLAVCRMVCAQQMATLMLNVDSGVPPAAVSDAVAADVESPSDKTLAYDVQVTPGVLDGLLVVRVSVRSLAPDGTTVLADTSLTRWIVDPVLGLEQLEAEMEAAAAEAAASSEDGDA